eukprot:6475570-Amphidinium_carterae.1
MRTQHDHDEYTKKVQADREYVMKKFFPARQRRVRHCNEPWKNELSARLRGTILDVAANDTGLPAAQVSGRARLMEHWCKQGSWTICDICGAMELVHLKEASSRKAAEVTKHRCKNCQKPIEKRVWVPTPEEVPEALQGLTKRCILVLRPLDIDCGEHSRNLATGSMPA